jgi:hypothetical protein
MAGLRGKPAAKYLGMKAINGPPSHRLMYTPVFKKLKLSHYMPCRHLGEEVHLLIPELGTR